MESYILKNSPKEEKILLYQEKTGYSFSPKKGSYRVKKITILNKEMIENILKEKINNKYNKLIAYIYRLIADDETDESAILKAYTEIDKIKSLLIYQYGKYLGKEYIYRYIKRVDLLKLELKKLHIMELEQSLIEEKGKGR